VRLCRKYSAGVMSEPITDEGMLPPCWPYPAPARRRGDDLSRLIGDMLQGASPTSAKKVQVPARSSLAGEPVRTARDKENTQEPGHYIHGTEQII
jgi:hypothetical protein